jgi:DNA-directed RNA polymerase subunit RPC12/RpoP
MSEEEVIVEHKCPKCGKSMAIGWIGSTGVGLVAWREGKKMSWRKRRERLQSIWSGECLRAYRCKECGIFICYERGKQPDYKGVEGTPKGFLKKCINCGKDIPIAAEECSYCGAKQKEKGE